MRLHENQQLFADAIEAAARPVQDGGLGIKSIFIEKDYWICRSLSLMATGDKDNRAIFKGGTSLTKAYGIGARFSEDIDVAIAEAWTLSGNQLKNLIRRTSKNMTAGLEELVIPGMTSKGSHYHKAFLHLSTGHRYGTGRSNPGWATPGRNQQFCQSISFRAAFSLQFPDRVPAGYRQQPYDRGIRDAAVRGQCA